MGHHVVEKLQVGDLLVIPGKVRTGTDCQIRGRRQRQDDWNTAGLLPLTVSTFAEHACGGEREPPMRDVHRYDFAVPMAVTEPPRMSSATHGEQDDERSKEKRARAPIHVT